jgi:hypothetical protein
MEDKDQLPPHQPPSELQPQQSHPATQVLQPRQTSRVAESDHEISKGITNEKEVYNSIHLPDDVPLNARPSDTGTSILKGSKIRRNQRDSLFF